MKRKAIRTSRKRVEAILKRREEQIRDDERVKEHDRCVRAMYLRREVGGDFPGNGVRFKWIDWEPTV